MSYQSRRWCFTWFDDEGVPPEYEEWMSYIVMGSETCPETGRQHWQGYLETSKKITLTGIKSKGGQWATCHLEKAHGTLEDNFAYCTKEGDQYLEFGEPMEAGKRTDLYKLADAVVSGATTVSEILVENPLAYHVYGRTLEKLEDQRLLRQTRGAWAPPVVKWFWGETGAGKSRTAMEEAMALANGDAKMIYRHTWDDNGWWDRYQGEPFVIFDEFRCQVPFHQLLTWLDGYEVCVKRRARLPVPLMATHIWVTSSKHPKDCYDKEKLGEDVGQLLRRLSGVTHFIVPF